MSGMDFFGHQERARRATASLVVLFVIAVAGITLCIYAAAMALLVAADQPGEGWFRPDVLLVVTASTLAVVGFAALFKTAQLRSGGRKVARLLGGTQVPIDTQDPRERMLRNLVEEMAIASGVPVPDIYVLDGETGINAFAAGWTSADAAVAVTRGCLEQLDRDELQGVIAHEFSHVFHGDMRLNIRLMGVLFGIVCIATIGRIVVRAVSRGAGSSSNSKGKGGAAGLVLFGIGLIVIGWLGVFFARLIQAAVSRQREFLADASAVQYTRNPRGIGMALAKIGGLGAQLRTAHAEEASHMLFADGMKRFLGGSLATHPPIEERVERVLPGFRRQLASAGSMVAAAASTPLPAGAIGLAGPGPAGDRDAPPASGRMSTQRFVQSIGDPQPANVAAARTLLQALPLELAAATREPGRCKALVWALLLDRESDRRHAQLAALRDRDPVTAHEALAMHPLLGDVAAGMRLPLLELAVPALRTLAADEQRQLRADARRLALVDGKLSPFEFALLRTMERHVRLPDERPARPPGRPTALVQHVADTTVVLSVLARVGAADAAGANAAFVRGHAHLGFPTTLALLPAERCTLEALEAAVDALAGVSPLGKRNLVGACAACAGADGTLTQEEADLLRALAEQWDCPVPLVTAAARPAPA